MSPRRGRDGAERLLALATRGLPARRAEWGAAMRAELAAVDDPRARRRFASSAAASAFGQSLGLMVTVALCAGTGVAAVALIESRVQLEHGGPGVLAVTVPVPAIVLFAVALGTTRWTRSFRIGVQAGILALVASLGAVFAVVALEGLVWIQRRGVFVLDGDPPRAAVGTGDVVFDLFTTGMWLAHVIFWLPWPLMGAGIGARWASVATRQGSRPVQDARAAL